jgi:hypothetical protein
VAFPSFVYKNTFFMAKDNYFRMGPNGPVICGFGNKTIHLLKLILNVLIHSFKFLMYFNKNMVICINLLVLNI